VWSGTLKERARSAQARGYGRLDERVVVPFFYEPPAEHQSIFITLSIRGRESQHGLAQESPHAYLGCGLGDGVFKIVHIGKGRHAGANHFRAGNLGPNLHEFRGYKLALERHQIAQPDVKP
jgi:hypothetical protein